MKIKIRPHDAHMPEEEDWLPTDDWLAALRDDGRAGPSHGHAQPASGSDPRPEVRAEVAARAEAGARTEAAAPAQAGARAEITGRAVIGDQLRMPVMWCEMGSCISWHARSGRARRGRHPRPRDRRRLAHRCPGPAGLPPVPAGRPRLPGHPPGRAVGPVHGHRQGRPDHRPARRRHRRPPRAGKRPRPPPPGRRPAGTGMAPPVPGRSDHPGRRRAERPASTAIPAARSGTRPGPGAVTAAARCTRQAGEHTRLTGRRWQRTHHTWRAAPPAAAG